MFNFHRLLPLLLLLGSAWAQESHPLTASNLVEMKTAGFADETIIGAVQVNGHSIDTSVQGLLNLKEAGLSDAVINAVLATKSPRTDRTSPPGPVIELPDKTSVRLVLAETISSGESKSGDVVGLTVATEVVVDGLVLIRKGAPATGRVTTARGRSIFKDRNGELTFAVDSVEAVDGQQISLDAKISEDGGDSGLFQMAKNVEFEAGFIVNAVVDGDQEVSISTETRSNPISSEVQQ